MVCGMIMSKGGSDMRKTLPLKKPFKDGTGLQIAMLQTILNKAIYIKKSFEPRHLFSH